MTNNTPAARRIFDAILVGLFAVATSPFRFIDWAFQYSVPRVIMAWPFMAIDWAFDAADRASYRRWQRKQDRRR